MDSSQTNAMKAVSRMPQYTHLVNKIRSLIAQTTHKPLLVALDGRSGVGKSTIAQAIAQDFNGVVIVGDDFFLGGSDSEWDARSVEAKVADCIDWRRLRQEALEPLIAGKAASWHPFNFISGSGLCPLGRKLQLLANVQRSPILCSYAKSNHKRFHDRISSGHLSPNYAPIFLKVMLKYSTSFVSHLLYAILRRLPEPLFGANIIW